jgi:hypothetical protein
VILDHRYRISIIDTGSRFTYSSLGNSGCVVCGPYARL